MSSKPIKHHKQLLIKIKKGPNENAQMNILLIFQIEFLLKLVVRKKHGRNHCGPTYHDHTTSFPCLHRFTLSICLKIPIVCHMETLHQADRSDSYIT